MFNLMYNCEIHKATVCYVDYLRSACNLFKLVITLINVYDVSTIPNKAYHFLVIVLKS